MKHRVLFLLLQALLMLCSTAWAANTDIITSNTSGAKLSFSMTNQYEWQWDSTNKRLKSTNEGVDNSTSQTTITISVETACKFIFDYAVSSESDYDKLTIKVDGNTVVSNVSGSISNSRTTALSYGTHTLTLQYVKDASEANGDDCAYISNMRFTSTEIINNTTSELTGETGVTEVICSEAGRLKTLCELAGFPKKLKITGKFTMYDFNSLMGYSNGNYNYYRYGSYISYIDMGDAIIEECSGTANSIYGGYYEASGAAGELVTGLIISNGGQDDPDYSDLRVLVLPDNLTNFVCNHNSKGGYYDHYLEHIYTRSAIPVKGISSYTYKGGILHVPEGTKDVWDAVVNKAIIVSDTQEKIITTPSSGCLSGYLTQSEISNVDILTINGYLDESDFATLKRMPQLTKLTINASLNGNVIPENAFQNNKTIKYVYSTAQIIGAYAFQNCENLQQVSFNFGKYTSYEIKDYAFDGCTNVELCNYVRTVYNSSGNEFIGLSYIGDFAFRNTRIPYIYLASNVSHIGKNPFINNKNNYYNGDKYYHRYEDDETYYPYNVIGITIESNAEGNQLIYSAEKLKLLASYLKSQNSIVVDDVTHTINDYALSDLQYVTHVTLGKNTESIGEAFMYSCPKFSSISVSEKNEYFCVKGGVLYTKNGETLVRYPAALVSDCELDKNVNTIRHFAFEGSKITNLKVLASTPPSLPFDAFENVDLSKLVVYVKESYLDAYKEHSVWGKLNLQAIEEPKVSEISLNTNTIKLEIGEKKTLIATCLPQEASNKELKWASSNTSVAIVSSNGVVTGIAKGSATIKVSATDGSGTQATCEVTVTPLNIALIDGEDYTGSITKTVDELTFSKTFSASSAGVWNAFYVPMSIDVEEYAGELDFAEIYAFCATVDTNGDGAIDANDEDFLFVLPVTEGSTLPNVPYLVRPKEAKTYVINSADNILYKSTEGKVEFATTHDKFTVTGLNEPFTVSAGDNNYYVSETGRLNYRTTGSATVLPNRWIMHRESKNYGGGNSNTTNSKGYRIMAIGEDISENEAATAIRNAMVEGAQTGTFTIDGRKVDDSKSLPAGLYIKNGKKVFIR